MATSMNRRTWIKDTALLAGAFTLAPSILNTLSASPIRAVRESLNPFSEKAMSLADPVLKARLFANENPFGPSDKAKQAAIEALTNSYQYPFMMERVLEQKIIAHEGIKEDQLIMSPGSSALLQAAAIHFTRDGGNIISGDPSYDDLMNKAEALEGKTVKVPLTSEYKLDLAAMEKMISKKTKLVYICNPNNPTGTVLDTATLKSFCERVSKKVPVFVDEAYIDYLGDPKDFSMIDLVKQGHNVIVARTFSKLYGFAGMRLGYVIAQPDMIKNLELYAQTQNSLSAMTIAAGIAAFRETEFLQSAFKKTMDSKEFLYSTLKKEGYEYIPSSTNFVMFKINMEPDRFVEEMTKRGVGVRPWKFNNTNWCRVSIGRMDEMEAFADAFKQIS